MIAPSLNVKLARATFLAFAGVCLWAEDGLPGALPQARWGTAFGAQLAVADFDSDREADGAVIVDHGSPRGPGVRIRLHLSGRASADFAAPSAGGAHSLAVTDIDGDGDLDLIVERALTRQRVHVWLNDGHGDFRKGSIQDFPAAAGGPELQDLAAPDEPPALFLPQSRGSDAAILSSGKLSLAPPRTETLRHSALGLWLPSAAFAQDPSRAPPAVFPCATA